MPQGEQRRPVRDRRIYRRPNNARDPIDEQSGIPTSPRFLVRQGFTGLFGGEGLYVDGRRHVGSYDEPGYVGDLSQPVTDDSDGL